MSTHGPHLDGLPGADLVMSGVEDLRNGRATLEATLICMAASRLRAAGLDVPSSDSADEPAGHRLYEMLVEEDPRAAYSRYNALVSRLVSFANAAEHARPR